MPALPQVLIIELGCQYTLNIERALRELGFRSVILEPRRAAQWLLKNEVRAVILSGGAASVYESNAPQPPDAVLFLRHDGRPVPVLGICYGMQWLAQRCNGVVKPVSGAREYGAAKLSIISDKLFDGTPLQQTVWMNHGDSVAILPEGWKAIGFTGIDTIAAMTNGVFYGVQFHPEVTHTVHGKKILENFMVIAGCERDWEPLSLVSSIREKTESELNGETCVFGFSGGVDSTTVAAVLSPVLKDRIHAITIDAGNLRDGELDEIRYNARLAGVNCTVIDARKRFIPLFHDTVDAEEKRRRFKVAYAEEFMRAAKECGATAVLQGTLATDTIESGGTGGACIKSHHNVGLTMPSLRQLHPISDLFKYEVRALAQSIGLPEVVYARQPFPGPGLFLRIVGVPVTDERLDILRFADKEVRAILQRHGLYDSLSQLIVAYLGLNTVGVKGSARVYSHMIGVRAVETMDFMTARGVYFPEVVAREISSVLTPHPAIGRILFDPTDKPPATTEFE